MAEPVPLKLDCSSSFVGIRTVNYHFFCLLPEAVSHRTVAVMAQQHALTRWQCWDFASLGTRRHTSVLYTKNT